MMKLYNLFLFYIGLNKTIKLNTGLSSIITRLTKYMDNNYIDNTTSLHRWCHITSDKYKTKCKWETKSDNANRDNSL